MWKECWNFKHICPQGHELTWSKSYPSNCSKCAQQINFSRWQCLTCKEAYCPKCYNTPQFGDKCPLGHPMVKQKLYSNTCDCCSKDIVGQGYRDSICDFDLCLKCRIAFIRED